MSNPDEANPLDHLVVRTASTLNRRRFLRRAGATAGGVAASLAFLPRYLARGDVLEDSETAAWQALNDSGLARRVCGPSPYCASTRCDGFNCHQSDRTRWRPYGGASCSDSSVQNCWTNGAYRCCDCCADRYYGGRTQYCSGCPRAIVDVHLCWPATWL